MDGDPDPGEVVWTWVAFEEDPEQGKDRPIVVIGRRGSKLVGVPLTSKQHDNEAQVAVGIRRSRSGRPTCGDHDDRACGDDDRACGDDDRACGDDDDARCCGTGDDRRADSSSATSDRGGNVDLDAGDHLARVRCRSRGDRYAAPTHGLTP